MLSAFVMSWFLSFGYVPVLKDCAGGNLESARGNGISTVAELGFSMEYDDVVFSASMESYQTFEGVASYAPFRMDFKASFDYQIYKDVTISFIHECDHPVSSNQKGRLKYDYLSSETQLIVTIKGSSK